MTVPDLDGRMFLTVTEYAELARCDPRTVRRAIAAGQIPAIQISGSTRIPVPKVREQLGLGPAAVIHRADAALEAS